MHDPARVRSIQRIRNFDPQLQTFIERHRLPGNSPLQRLAIEKLHGDEWTPVRFADFINRANVWMIESRSRLRLALKSLQRLAISDKFIREEFQSHKAVQRSVLSFEHHAHSAATEFFQHPVVRNHPPRK